MFLYDGNAGSSYLLESDCPGEPQQAITVLLVYQLDTGFIPLSRAALQRSHPMRSEGRYIHDVYS